MKKNRLNVYESSRREQFMARHKEVNRRQLKRVVSVSKSAGYDIAVIFATVLGFLLRNVGTGFIWMFHGAAWLIGIVGRAMKKFSDDHDWNK